MATLTKFNAFVEHLSKGYHNLSTGTITVALTSVAPVATNSVLADLTQISYTNLSSRVVTVASCVQTSGTLKFICNDLVLTASGAVASFEYVVLYNASSTTVTSGLIGFYDYGSAVILANLETFTIDFDNVNGVLTLA